jgi:choline dehydrogenase-like flavoprotein
LQKIADFKPIPQNSHFIRKSLKVYYHPTGSLMTGKNSSSCVTDENLRIRYVENLYICSTAVFPYGGSANTGLTLLALASRLSDYIKKKINL